MFECARSYTYSQNFHVHTSHIQLHNGTSSVRALLGAGPVEVEPVDGHDPCALYTESLASTVSRYPNVACAREALGLYMPSARADAFTTGAWHPRSM